MFRSLIARQLDRQEETFGVSLDYVRHILRASLPAFLKFGLFMPLAQHRRQLPYAAFAVARIVAARNEDCGTCVQLEVNQAQQAGVEAALISTVLNDHPADLPTDLANVYHFTKAVIEQTGREGEYRPLLESQWGEAALVELALAIGTARTFPVIKRALGYATSCALYQIQVQHQPNS